MKKIIILFITLLLCSHYALAEPQNQNKNDPNDVIAINKQLTLMPKTQHQENTEFKYAIDAAIPQIQGEKLDKAALKLNALINAVVEQQIQQFKKEVALDLPRLAQLPESVRHNTLDIAYDATVIKPGNHVLVSIRLSIEVFKAGRAHPSHLHHVFNYDLTTGKLLSLKELFKPGAAFLPTIAAYCKKELSTRLPEEDKWMLKDGTAPLAKNYADWNITDDGISILFSEYQVAPYVAGPQVVEIPYSVLQKMISPNSPIAACATTLQNCGI